MRKPDANLVASRLGGFGAAQAVQVAKVGEPAMMPNRLRRRSFRHRPHWACILQKSL